MLYRPTTEGRQKEKDTGDKWNAEADEWKDK